MTIQTITLENHAIVLNNNKLVSVTSAITGRFVKHSVGYMLLAAKASVDANKEFLERLSNQTHVLNKHVYVLNKNTASTAFNDIVFIKQSLTPLFNIVMTMFCLILRCLFTVKHVIKKYSLDIVECLIDLNYIDIALMLSCIVLFVLIVF